VPRTATIYAKSPARLLEIRWQGLNVLRKFDPGWQQAIDEGYRKNQLITQLKKHDLFRTLSDDAINAVAERTAFETYGSFEWTYKYRRQTAEPVAEEPIIAAEGDYADGLLMLSGGFARVTKRVGNGARTLTYLRDGDTYALDELHQSWINERRKVPLQTTLHALGYVNLLRIPATVLEEYVFPSFTADPDPLTRHADRPLAHDAILEWAVDNRFINATQAMVLDLERCVRCDDCVRACENTHAGNPRFVRAGPQLGQTLIAHACMHCIDPVCMIDCPTGAIHRTPDGGVVVINDETCIGCSTCASACPYNNIQMVEVRDQSGSALLDEAKRPILKATKCDLCLDQATGPACVQACPHGALIRTDFRDVHASIGRRP
ncbi:MAG: 4Fe-4S dicluster domain-containing protein, partial [Pseudomonadota bacterium]